jgi:hypothetical protein
MSSQIKTFPLRECVLEFQRVCKYSVTIGGVTRIPIEEFNPGLLTFHRLVKCLEKEMKFKRDKEVICYVQPEEAIDPRGKDRVLVVATDLGLRSGIRVLQTHGGSMFRFLIAPRGLKIDVDWLYNTGIWASISGK